MKVALDVKSNLSSVFQGCIRSLGHEVVSRGEQADVLISDCKDWDELRQDLNFGRCRMIVQFVWQDPEHDQQGRPAIDIRAEIINLSLIQPGRRHSAIYDKLAEVISCGPTIH